MTLYEILRCYRYECTRLRNVEMEFSSRQCNELCFRWNGYSNFQQQDY